MNCKDCRWHFALDAKVEPTGWANCMALPYPQCYSLTHVSAECPVPHLFKPVLVVVKEEVA